MVETWQRVAQAVAAVTLAVAVTAVASWLFHGRVGADFVSTGAVAALIVNGIIDLVTTRLLAANRALAREVMAREAELQAGRAAANVAHEVKNPLSAVVGNLELCEELLGEPLDPDELRASVRSALAAARHIQTLVADFGPLSEPTTGSADLAEAAAAAVRIAAPQLELVGRAELAVPELPRVRLSSGRMVQVLLNLVLNAAQASRSGVENVVRVAAHAEGAGVHVVVADRGKGMPDEVLARALEPGFTTRAGRGGTGLGLPIVRQIVESSGGRIRLQSQGVGTEVHLWLPAEPRGAAPDAGGAAG